MMWHKLELDYTTIGSQLKETTNATKNRICTLGSDDIGDGLHCMLLCSFSKIQQCKQIVQRTLSHFDSI